MNQDLIWDHFQNEGVEAFSGAGARIEFLVRHLSRGERVLDIGVGSGGLARMAVEKGVDMWALDPSERSIKKLQEDLGLGDRAQIGYSQQIPYSDGHFDTVIMSEVLEHLEQDVLAPTLSEVHRVLRPNGRFIGTVPARENLAESMVVCPCCGHHFHRWGHRSSFDRAALQKLLATNFRNVRAEEHFLIEWDRAGWRRRGAGLLKKFLSWRGIGTYGTLRNLFFVAVK